MKNPIHFLTFIVLLPLGMWAQHQPAEIAREMISFDQSMRKMQKQSFSIQQGNHVFIEQMGNQNIVGSKVRAQKSDLNFRQHGNQNVAVVGAEVKSIEGNILQDGDRNYSFDFVNDPTAEMQLDLVQKGTGHHFEQHGSNSISDRLQVRMTGDSGAIIIRNFQ